jgi:hypothetical protein
MTCTAPRSLARPLTFLAVLFSLSLAASTAEAGKVVVLRVVGDPEGELEDGLMSIIEDRHDLVTSGEFERAARKSGIEDLDGPALGKLARKLGADALIEGTVSREDEGFLLVVRIRGKNGKTVKKVSVDLAKPRFSAKAKKRVGTVVLDGIDMVLGIAPEGDEGDDEEADEEERPKKKSRKERNRGKRSKAKAERDAEALADDEDRPRRRGGDDEEDEGEDDEGDEDEGDDEDDDDDRDRVAARDDDDDADEALGIRRDDDDGDGARRKTVFPIARVELGPSAKLRTLAFSSREFDQAPLGYKSSMVPGVRVAGEAYPIGMVMGGPVSNLGVGFEYDQTLGMTSRSSDAPDVTLPTLQKHWDVGARYRIPFGKKANAPMVVLGGGIGRRFFIVDRSSLPDGAELDMPDVAYKYYHAGASVRMPIGMRAAVQAGARGLAFQSAGSITDLDSYGRAKLTGLDASLSAEFMVTPKVIASLAGSFTQIGFAFEGDGAESNNRDLDPTSVDVGGASDRYIGVVGTVGYVY